MGVAPYRFLPNARNLRRRSHDELFHDRGQEWPNRRSWPERAAGGPKLASKMPDAQNVSTLNCRISGSNGQDRGGAVAILHPSGIRVARRPRPPAALILTSDEPPEPGTGKFVKFPALPIRGTVAPAPHLERLGRSGGRGCGSDLDVAAGATPYERLDGPGRGRDRGGVIPDQLA